MRKLALAFGCLIGILLFSRKSEAVDISVYAQNNIQNGAIGLEAIFFWMLIILYSFMLLLSLPFILTCFTQMIINLLEGKDIDDIVVL